MEDDDVNDIDVMDNSAFDDCAEQVTGSLMDAIMADNSVDPLSADYEDDDEE